uniref:Endonuclease/exonuclease/phosphatase domain-containing protein n=1 Tax=Trichogramma kaykai TaxID=54128 RepID=A0ABD2WIP8_9HYME
MPSVSTEILENTIIKIFPKNANPIFIISIYASPTLRSNIEPDLIKIASTLRLSDDGNPFIMIGDFNARHHAWRDVASNQRGRQIENWSNSLSNLSLKILYPTEPTFQRSGSHLDFAIASAALEFNSEELILHPYASDHLAIECTLRLQHKLAEDTGPSLDNFLIFKKTNWNKFKRMLTHNANFPFPADKNLSNAEIDSGLHVLQAHITEALEKCTPRFKPFNILNTIVNAEIKKLYNAKHKLQTKIHRLINRRDRNLTAQINHHKAQVKIIKKKIEEAFNKASKNNWNNQIKKINYKESASFFPSLNRFFRNNIKNNNQLIKEIVIKPHEHELTQDLVDPSTLNRHSDTSITDQTVITEVISRFFGGINRADPNSNTLLEKDILKGDSELTNTFTTLDTFVTFNENLTALDPNLSHQDITFASYNRINKIIKQMKGKTSTGWDNIPNIALKNLPPNYIAKRACNTGFTPPETFKFLDENKLIIGDNMEHILYNFIRHCRNKRIPFGDAQPLPMAKDTGLLPIDAAALRRHNYFAK